MAIYHFSAKVISRGKGQSAIASASYRSGEKLKDERTGEMKFYRRDVQPDSMILAPSHSPEWVKDRQKLWNEVENAEKRVNSQLARDVEISLPRELSHAQQKELIQNYAQEQFVNKRMVADISIHRDNESNPHAHIMLTTREISPEGFTNKNRDWNDRQQLEQWREQWSVSANKTMEREGINERIDHRSFEKKNIEELPTQHLGHQAHALEKKGVQTERGDYNREVKAYNQEIRKNVVELQKYREEKQQIERNIRNKANPNKAKEVAGQQGKKASEGFSKAQQKTTEQQKPKQKFLKENELADIKQATKVTKGYVTLDTIKERKTQLNNWSKSLDNKRDNLNRTHDQYKKAQSYVEKLHDIEHKKARATNEIKSVKDIKSTWEYNKWEGAKKALNRTFNPKEGNERIEKAQKDIQYLEKHEQNFNKYLEPYREKLNFQSREEFYMQQRKFENDKSEGMNDIRNQRATIKDQHQTLDKAENALQRKEVREITSKDPDLKHLGDSMKHKDALKLKEINELSGQTVPINQLKEQLQERTDIIDKSEKRLQVIGNSEKQIERAESNFNKLEKVESKIDQYDNNPFLKGKKLFSKDSKQEYEKLNMQRDQLQKALNKDGYSSREDLDKYKETVERVAQKERPELEKDIQQAKEGENGVDIDKLNDTVKGVERAEKGFERAEKGKERFEGRERELSKGREIQMER